MDTKLSTVVGEKEVPTHWALSHLWSFSWLGCFRVKGRAIDPIPAACSAHGETVTQKGKPNFPNSHSDIGVSMRIAIPISGYSVVFPDHCFYSNLHKLWTVGFEKRKGLVHSLGQMFHATDESTGAQRRKLKTLTEALSSRESAVIPTWAIWFWY